MKVKLLMLLMIGCHLGFGQRIYSDCSDNANGDGLRYFEDDVDQLLLRNLEKYDPQYLYYNVTVKRDSFQYIFRKLMAIRNATTLPFHGVIFNTLQLHSSYDIPMRNVNIVADSNLYWMVNLKKGNYFSGHSQIDTLIKYYGLRLRGYSPWISGSDAILAFNADRNINAQALPYFFNQIQGVRSFLFRENVGSSRDIQITRLNDSADLIAFYHRWGDCPAGCIWSVKWEFVVYNECSFEYKGLSGDVQLFKQMVSANHVLKNQLSVYPNPFTNTLQIQGLVNDVVFNLYDARGALVLSGTTVNATIEGLGFILPGLYFLETGNSGSAQKIMLAKY